MRPLLKVILATLCMLVFSMKGYGQQGVKANEIRSWLKSQQSLPKIQKKIIFNIREHKKKMVNENARSQTKDKNISKKYSTEFIPVDDSARMLITVVLVPNVDNYDIDTLVQAISSLGGKIKSISKPWKNYQREIYGWIPYEQMEKVAELSKVSAIELFPKIITN
jgi:hypothetical protein